MTNSTTVRGGVFGVALAWVLTSLVFVVGNMGAPIRVVTGWAPDGADLRVIEYVLTAAIAVALGAALLWAMERRGRDRLRAWTAIVALVAGGSTLPLWGLDVDRGSKWCLTLMHLLTGAAAVAGQRLARNRPTVRSQDSAAASAS
ncbi:MAG: hypothetical protein RJA49_977 [Actinomycetota bacterium]